MGPDGMSTFFVNGDGKLQIYWEETCQSCGGSGRVDVVGYDMLGARVTAPCEPCGGGGVIQTSMVCHQSWVAPRTGYSAARIECGARKLQECERAFEL